MKFGGLEPRRYEDIKEIVAPEIDPKSFGTFEKQAPGLSLYPEGSQNRMENVYNYYWRFNCVFAGTSNRSCFVYLIVCFLVTAYFTNHVA